MEKISHFINGKIYSVSGSRTGPIFNPAIGQQIAEVELANKDTIKLAVDSSSKAFLNGPKLLQLIDLEFWKNIKV